MDPINLNKISKTIDDWYTSKQITQISSFIGNTGFGKTYGIQYIGEKYMENKWPVTFVDPQGIYYALREEYDELAVIGGRHGDFSFDEIDKVLPVLLDNNVNHVLDFIDFEPHETQELLGEIFRFIYNWHVVNRKPRHYVLEECDMYIGQSGVDQIAKTQIIKCITKGRMHGFGTTMVSQRFRMVDKTPLNQTNNYVIFNMKGSADLLTLRKLLGQNIDQRIIHLDVGKCLIIDGKTDLLTYKIPEKKTTHAAATPEFGIELQDIKIKELSEKVKSLFDYK